MLVAARQTPNGANHEKKRDPRKDEITENQVTELDSHARLKKRTFVNLSPISLRNLISRQSISKKIWRKISEDPMGILFGNIRDTFDRSYRSTRGGAVRQNPDRVLIESRFRPNAVPILL